MQSELRVLFGLTHSIHSTACAMERLTTSRQYELLLLLLRWLPL